MRTHHNPERARAIASHRSVLMLPMRFAFVEEKNSINAAAHWGIRTAEFAAVRVICAAMIFYTAATRKRRFVAEEHAAKGCVKSAKSRVNAYPDVPSQRKRCAALTRRLRRIRRVSAATLCVPLGVPKTGSASPNVRFRRVHAAKTKLERSVCAAQESVKAMRRVPASSRKKAPSQVGTLARHKNSR
jgi:hypothetical protein